MAVEETIYRVTYNNHYYTAAGLEDLIAHSSTTYTSVPVRARRYTVTVKLIDANAGKLYYSHTGNENVISYSRSGEKFYTTDGATSELSYNAYVALNDDGTEGAALTVYGAHPAAPGLSAWYTSASLGAVNFSPSSSDRYAFVGGMTHIEGDYETRAPGLASGTAYDASKIVYSNSANQLRFGFSVSRDKSFAVYAGYRWFVAISPIGVTLADSVNTQTRTVANGVKRALITDIEGYNAGTASATVKASTGTLTFVYRYVFRQNMGDYEPGTSSRAVQPLTAVDAATGGALVLRALETKADGTGTSYAIGDEISGILTRRPGMTAYDTRVTLYGRFVNRVDITLDHDGGTSQVSTVYRSPEDAQFFADERMLETIQAVPVPTKSNAVFEGYYSGDVQAVTADGRLAVDYAPTASETLLARWRTVVDVVLDKGDGSGGTSMLSYDSAMGGFTADGGAQTVSSITPPRRPQWRFDGYFSASTGGTLCIDSDGALTDYLISLGSASPTTLHARWTRISYRMTLDRSEGVGGPDAVYCDGTTATFYMDEELTEPTDYIETPTFEGHTFGGFYLDGALVVSERGEIVSAPFAADVTAQARWTVRSYVLTFSYSGGSGSVESMSVTWGQPVGTLPEAVHPVSGRSFEGWMVGGVEITADTVWSFDFDAVAVAKWSTGFGDVVDWFDLASDALIPESSHVNDVPSYVAVAHTGRLERGVTAIGGLWRAPSVTYRVVKDLGLNVLLGSAFAGVLSKSSASKMAISGYMIVSVAVHTALGEFPTVTVSAAANEGFVAQSNGKKVARATPAINTATVSVAIRARARAQSLGVFVDSDELSVMSNDVVFSSDAVVLDEDMMPCSSDIVNMRASATVVTNALTGNVDAARPAADAGWTRLEDATSNGGTSYPSISTHFERGL